ncbi:sulfhydryl oxidase 2-like [Diorhabda carinulata]|uniref:sulfhydryl oxidase 2-like n=1 Tax=Diorhabda carinulata TaxID=1163345 RepID=UPI0025A186BF|nr:sulfhydryl oxidase 2-like [Diorhabda carinulata]
MSHICIIKIIYTILILVAVSKLSVGAGINQNKLLKTVQTVNNAQQYKKYSEKIGLYSLDNDVEILTVDNFKNEVYGNDRAWLIEFYNAWCGFCQRFAPSWKEFATDIAGWKGLVGVGAIDCANEQNTGICREFEIMGYPTLKYFHEKYTEGPKNLGEKVSSQGQANEHRQNLLNVIIAEQKSGRGKMYPNLLPFVGKDIDELFSNEFDQTFLIVQEYSDYLGQEVIMDLNKIKKANVRYAFYNNTELTNKIAVKKVPALVVINKDKTFKFLQVKAKRELYKLAIQKYLGSIQIVSSSKERYLGKGEDKNVPDVIDFLEEREKNKLKQKIKRMGDVVFQMDLETALRYSLKHEVASVKEITKEQLQALKNYLHVIAKYFPFGRNGQLFLKDLKEFVWFKTVVKGEDIGNFVKHAEKENQLVFSSPQHWLACKGSSPNYRGYPCGLWKLFHYLVVNAAINEEIQDSNPGIVLEAMHGYIKHFFGCSECSQHFQNMAKRREIFNITSWDDSILWLWSAHNEVNKRLSGDETEDPEYPKYQFPSKERCPRCYHEDNSWNIVEVLHYIKHVYSNINVRYIGSDTKVLHLILDNRSNTESDAGIFKTIDTALCLILYLASFMLLLVLIYVFLRRSYRNHRKKLYQHALLGKV